MEVLKRVIRLCKIPSNTHYDKMKMSRSPLLRTSGLWTVVRIQEKKSAYLGSRYVFLCCAFQLPKINVCLRCVLPTASPWLCSLGNSSSVTESVPLPWSCCTHCLLHFVQLRKMSTCCFNSCSLKFYRCSLGKSREVCQVLPRPIGKRFHLFPAIVTMKDGTKYVWFFFSSFVCPWT